MDNSRLVKPIKGREIGGREKGKIQWKECWTYSSEEIVDWKTSSNNK